MKSKKIDKSKLLEKYNEIKQRKIAEKEEVERLYNGDYEEGYDKIIDKYGLHNLDKSGTIFVFGRGGREEAKEFLFDCIHNETEYDFLSSDSPKLFIAGYGNLNGEYKSGDEIWVYLKENDDVLIYSDKCIIGWAKISKVNKKKYSVNFSNGEIFPKSLNLECLLKYEYPQFFIKNYFKKNRTSNYARENFEKIFRGKSIIKVSNEDIKIILNCYRPRGELHPCFE